MNKAPYPRIL